MGDKRGQAYCITSENGEKGSSVEKAYVAN